MRSRLFFAVFCAISLFACRSEEEDVSVPFLATDNFDLKQHSVIVLEHEMAVHPNIPAKAELLEWIYPKMPRLRILWKQYAQEFPQANQDTVVFRFSILANGRIGDIAVEKSTLENNKFNKKVILAMRQWTWPAIENGEVEVLLPLSLSNPRGSP
jgi:TonB family protein